MCNSTLQTLGHFCSRLRTIALPRLEQGNALLGGRECNYALNRVK